MTKKRMKWRKKKYSQTHSEVLGGKRLKNVHTNEEDVNGLQPKEKK